MKKLLLLTAILLTLPPARAQFIEGFNINASGGYDIIIPLEKVVVTVNAVGIIEAIDTDWVFEFETYGERDNPYNYGEFKELDGYFVDYFNPLNTDDGELFGKLRRLGNMFFDYHTDYNCPYPELWGKMCRAGYAHIEYFDPETTPHEEIWGKICRIDSLRIDYYTPDDGGHPDRTGLLKQVGGQKYDYRISKKGLPESSTKVAMNGRKRFTASDMIINVYNYL